VSDPRPLSRLLNSALASKKLRREVALARLRGDWTGLVGPAVARRTELAVSGRELVVRCGDAECRRLLEELLPRIRARLDELFTGELTSLRLVE